MEVCRWYDSRTCLTGSYFVWWPFFVSYLQCKLPCHYSLKLVGVVAEYDYSSIKSFVFLSLHFISLYILSTACSGKGHCWVEVATCRVINRQLTTSTFRELNYHLVPDRILSSVASKLFTEEAVTRKSFAYIVIQARI